MICNRSTYYTNYFSPRLLDARYCFVLVPQTVWRLLAAILQYGGCAQFLNF